MGCNDRPLSHFCLARANKKLEMASEDAFAAAQDSVPAATGMVLASMCSCAKLQHQPATMAMTANAASATCGHFIVGGGGWTAFCCAFLNVGADLDLLLLF